MRTVTLTSGDVAMVDDADYEVVAHYIWRRLTSLSGGVYAQASVAGKCIQMHRLLVTPSQGDRIDHIDGNGLNNQRFNLRSCTHAENMRNRKRHVNNKSGLKGVYFDPDRGSWRAQIRAAGVKRYLGSYRTKELAHAAYCAAAATLHGEFFRAG